ncbi:MULTISPECIES: energy transducer TonB [unclassified Caballeronia]|uniref:energy transducer TonB n=1 Tax=unclassified Caballeronia TaxID=2646786 RepID=UPI00286C38A7|nr:energy transducer TonB [Caballeronia sp. LZ033]
MRRLFFASALAIAGSGCAQQETSESRLSCDIAEPYYPTVSLQRRESGSVKLKVKADREGKIASVEVLESSNRPLLDAAAISAMKRSRCTPYYADGQAVEVGFTVPFTFSVN